MGQHRGPARRVRGHGRRELKEIGGYDDAATGLRGVRRLALTDEDDRARRLVVGWMRDAGMTVRIDEIGNVYAVRPGRDQSLPCVLMGSHIDTVATGGAFDGTLGVLGAVEAVRAMNEAGVETAGARNCSHCPDLPVRLRRWPGMIR